MLDELHGTFGFQTDEAKPAFRILWKFSDVTWAARENERMSMNTSTSMTADLLRGEVELFKRRRSGHPASSTGSHHRITDEPELLCSLCIYSSWPHVSVIR